MSVYGTHIFPRDSLTLGEKRRLEKQFGEQVPEFSEYMQLKRKHENGVIVASAVMGALAYLPSRKIRNPIMGIVASVFTFCVTYISMQSPFVTSLYGLKNYNQKECDRAFNLWVYYTQQGHGDTAKNDKRRDEQYVQSLQQFRANYARSEYDPKELQ